MHLIGSVPTYFAQIKHIAMLMSSVLDGFFSYSASYLPVDSIISELGSFLEMPWEMELELALPHKLLTLQTLLTLLTL